MHDFVLFSESAIGTSKKESEYSAATALLLRLRSVPHLARHLQQCGDVESNPGPYDPSISAWIPSQAEATALFIQDVLETGSLQPNSVQWIGPLLPTVNLGVASSTHYQFVWTVVRWQGSMYWDATFSNDEDHRNSVVHVLVLAPSDTVSWPLPSSDPAPRTNTTQMPWPPGSIIVAIKYFSLMQSSPLLIDETAVNVAVPYGYAFFHLYWSSYNLDSSEVVTSLLLDPNRFAKHITPVPTTTDVPAFRPIVPYRDSPSVPSFTTAPAIPYSTCFARQLYTDIELISDEPFRYTKQSLQLFDMRQAAASLITGAVSVVVTHNALSSLVGQQQDPTPEPVQSPGLDQYLDLHLFLVESTTSVEMNLYAYSPGNYDTDFEQADVRIVDHDHFYYSTQSSMLVRGKSTLKVDSARLSRDALYTLWIFCAGSDNISIAQVTWNVYADLINIEPNPGPFSTDYRKRIAKQEISICGAKLSLRRYVSENIYLVLLFTPWPTNVPSPNFTPSMKSMTILTLPLRRQEKKPRRLRVPLRRRRSHHRSLRSLAVKRTATPLSTLTMPQPPARRRPPPTRTYQRPRQNRAANVSIVYYDESPRRLSTPVTSYIG